MQSFFRAGPLLMTNPISTKQIQIPSPAQGTWSWLDPQTTQSFQECQIKKPDTNPQIAPRPYTAIHGYLKLKSLNDLTTSTNG